MHSTSTNHNADRIIANLLFCVTAMNVQINFGTIQYDQPTLIYTTLCSGTNCIVRRSTPESSSYTIPLQKLGTHYNFYCPY